MRETSTNEGVPPGARRTISTSPAHVCVNVTSAVTLVTGPETPETAKLITSGAPYCGGVPEFPSGIAPTPVPGKVAAGAAESSPLLFELAFVVFVLAPNHKAIATIPKTVMQ